MNIKVLYHSSTGNTRKLAYAIADTLKIPAEKIGESTLTFSEPVDLLFIGDGIYFGKANKQTIALINQLDPGLVRNVAVFATYGGQEKIGSDLSKLLQDRGLTIVEEPFTCKGQSWLVLNRHHPNESDLQKIRAYAKKVLNGISQK